MVRRALLVAAAFLPLAACGVVGPKGSPAGNDLPKEDAHTVDADRSVFENFEDFPNVVVWCDGTTRVYTTQRDQRPIILVLNDRQCGGDGPGVVVGQPQ